MATGPIHLAKRLLLLLACASLAPQGDPGTRTTPAEVGRDEGDRLLAAVQAIRRDQGALLARDSRTLEELRAIVQRHLGPIDFETLDPEHIRRWLRPYIAELSDERRAALFDGIERRARSEDTSGLRFAALWVELAPSTADVGRLVRHQALPALIADRDSRAVPEALFALATVPDERLVPFAPEIADLAEGIPADDPELGALLGMLAVFDALPHVGEHPSLDPSLRPQRERLRLRLRELCSTAGELRRGARAADVDDPLGRWARYLSAPASLFTIVGRPAPALEFQWAAGPVAPLRDLSELRGKVIVLEFWATWCEPCVACFEPLRELQGLLDADRTALIGVTSLGADEGADREGAFRRLAAYAAKHEVTWTIAVSTEDVFAPEWGVREIPYLVIVDTRGTVRHAGLDLWSLGGRGVARLVEALLVEQRGGG